MEDRPEFTESKIKSLYLKNKNFFLILFFAISIRIFSFLIVMVLDSRNWIEMSSFLFNGINPYETDVEFFYKYPPLFHYLINFFGLLSDFSYAGPKIMVISFDIFNIIVIYKIGIVLKGKTLGRNVALLYSMNPLIIVQVIHDVNEFVTLFFTLLCIYFLVLEKYSLSSFFLALGIAFKIYPVFLLIPIILFLYKNTSDIKFRMKKIFLYLIIIVITLVFVSLPFLILSPNIFLEKILIHTSRLNRGDSLTERIPELLIMYETAFEIFNISISYQFILQSIILFIVFIIPFIFKKDFNIYDLFLIWIIIALLLPIINYQIQIKYTNLIAFPFLLLIMCNKMKDCSEGEYYFLYFINFVPTIIFFMLYILLFPPIDNLLSTEILVEKGLVFGLVLLSSLVLFTFNEYKHRKDRDFIIPILNILPFITHNFIRNYWGDLIALSIIFFNLIYTYKKYWNRL